MNWLWSFILYSIPWELQLAAALIVALIVLYLLVRIFGFERVKRWILPVLALIGVGALASRNRQAGYQDRRAEEEKALDRAEEIVEDEKQDVRLQPDVEIDSEIDEWTRKDKR